MIPMTVPFNRQKVVRCTQQPQSQTTAIWTVRKCALSHLQGNTAMHVKVCILCDSFLKTLTFRHIFIGLFCFYFAVFDHEEGECNTEETF